MGYTAIWAFFPKIRTIFFNFFFLKKGRRDLPLSPPSSYAPAIESKMNLKICRHSGTSIYPKRTKTSEEVKK